MTTETTDLRQLRAEVRAMIREEIAGGAFEPRCDAWLTGFDAAFTRRLAERGWVGMTLPAKYGGHGRSYAERYAVIEELLAAGAPVAAHWIADRQSGALLVRYGTEEQRQRILPGIARGETYFAIGMSEPNAGSDLAAVKTRAVPVAGGWSVTGTKIWTSNAQWSHYLIALVRTAAPTERKHDGLSQLIIDLAGPGVQVRPIKLLSGEPHFNEVVFDEAFVPAENLVGAEGDGWRQVTAELSLERSGPERFLSTFPLLAETVGELSAQPNERGPQIVGELFARLRGLRALSMRVADRLSAGEDPAIDAALVKDLGTRFEGDVVEAVRLALRPEHAGERWRRLYAQAVTAMPGFTLRGGTNEILRGVVARALTQ